ncbi:MAG TPA: hypothetical protein VMS31_16650, partial [Pyrinomonadaceae bacterium]|nr:hypothetical protein [Pyrinomonadaceae bacterium]
MQTTSRERGTRLNPPSGWQDKAWGEAQRNPRFSPSSTATRGAGDSASDSALSPASRAEIISLPGFLGFRYASPQALCCHPLRGLRFIPFWLALMACLVLIAPAQTPGVPPADARGVIKLRVRLGDSLGTKARGLSRKRFFLIKGSLEENRSLVQAIAHR